MSTMTFATRQNRLLACPRRPSWLHALALLLAATFLAGTAHAAVDLRVESRPVADPIQAYVTVTDAMGKPVDGLTVTDFTLTLDGQLLTIPPADFSLPPSQNPVPQHVSVVFAMDYSPSTQDDGVPCSIKCTRTKMQDAVVAFIDSMRPGDYAAIVKFNGKLKATVVQSFMIIDGGPNNSVLIAAATAAYDGGFTNLYDGIDVALDHFSAWTGALPAGPKAVILISDGGDNASVATGSSVVDKASGLGIPVFTIALSTADTKGQSVMNGLAALTGGTYIFAPVDAAIPPAYGLIATQLNNGYLLTFQPQPLITDCNQHTLQVVVTGQGTIPASVKFTRCDGPPPQLSVTGGASQVVVLGAAVGAGTVVPTGAGPLTFTWSSSNTGMLPNSGISISGTSCGVPGSDCAVNMTPAAGKTGAATITVTATDPYGRTAQATLSLTINVPPASGGGGGGGGGTFDAWTLAALGGFLWSLRLRRRRA